MFSLVLEGEWASAELADLAQLGERKTEVLEVPSSILGVGR